MSAPVIELNTAESVDQFIEKQSAALLYFYNDRCAPCISLRPKVVEMLKHSFDKMQLGFINSEKHEDIAASYHAFSNPTLVVFFEGKEYKRVSKYISIPQLTRDIDRPYEMIFGE